MREYLIRADDGDFLIPPVGDLAATVHPAGRECQPVDGLGDYRMRCDELVVAFSFEEPGIHVVAESAEVEATDALVESIAAQVSNSMGRDTFVIPL